MKQAVENKDCCGCNACAQRCPTQCISLQPDEQGFLYPQVDESNCINCGLCNKVCPFKLQLQTETKPPRKVYAAFCNSDSIRMASSSGGIFTLLSEYVFDNNGVVFGARFDENWNVIHDFANSPEGLKPFRRSKYIQSSINDCYIQVESYLKSGILVLFTGTPCQIAGLTAFLGKTYENLLLADIACHGVPSPFVWQSYLQYTFSNKCPSITDINFRDKTSGWKQYSFTVKFHDDVFQEFYGDNLFMRGFLSNLYLRPSCYACKIKSGRSHSDITIADFWGVQKILPEVDDNKGISLLLVNSEKGESTIKQIGCDLYPVDYNDAIKYNPSIVKSANKPEQYNWFWDRFKENGCMAIDQAINWKPSVFKRIIRKTRSFLEFK